MNTEMIIAMAKYMPERLLLETIMQSIKSYIASDYEDKNKKRDILMKCHLFIAKYEIEKEGKSVEELAAEIDAIKAISDRMTGAKSKN